MCDAPPAAATPKWIFTCLVKPLCMLKVPAIARNTGKVLFKCPESAPARAATSPIIKLHVHGLMQKLVKITGDGRAAVVVFGSGAAYTYAAPLRT
eukprot:5119424-Pleurochrysis_carterae.AAC.2